MPDNIREIDRDYHLGLIAKNSEELVGYQAAALKHQSRVAAANLAAFHGVQQRQDDANRHLSSIAADMGTVIDQLGLVDQGIQDLNAEARETNDAIRSLQECLTELLDSIAAELSTQSAILVAIANTLQNPYEAKVLELRREADKWLRSGAGRTGRDRDEDWNDALRLYRHVLENPIGMQDYVVWFQLGWLQWKHTKSIGEAEQSFYRAQRLASPSRDLYYLKSLRHLACMQYLLGRHEDAYTTIETAVTVSRDHDTLFDAARYAAKTGRNTELSNYLSECIDLRPTTIVQMFSESDFL